MSEEFGLVRWDAMKTAVAECHSVDEITQIRNQAEAYRYALKQAKESPEVIRKAEEIKLRAERRAGELLKETPKAKGAAEKDWNKTPLKATRALSDMGISYDQSSKWQKIAEIPEEKFENFISVSEELSTAGIIRISRQAEREEKISKMRDANPEAPEGKYNVIVIDPPWDMKIIGRDVRMNQISLDYPTMSLDEIKEMKIPAADSCHVFLWTTQKYLPLAFDCFKAWDVKYVLTMVWHKTGGFQPFNLPQYNCEFVLYGRIGTPEFSDTKNFNVCFNANRGKHSEKPLEFYELIKRVTSGKRIDMFSRKKISGFKGWGNELEE